MTNEMNINFSGSDKTTKSMYNEFKTHINVQRERWTRKITKSLEQNTT